MATAREMFERIAAVDLTKIAGDIASRKIEQIRDKQIKQLMAGLDNQGFPLRPSILNDPYFKTRQAAENYARWKKKLFPETPFGQPNLIIIGTYHDSISIRASASALNWSASVSFAGSVADKYKGKELGLNEDSKHAVWVEDIRTDLIKEVSRKTGIKVK